MDAHLLDAHPEQAIRCREDSCSRILPHISAEVQHFQIVHEQGLFTCPAEGCDEEFLTMDKKRKHVKRKHPDELFHECVHQGCNKRFKMSKQMHAHVREDHLLPKFACTEDGCEMEFQSQREMTQHVKGYHQGQNHVCKFPGCDFSCVSKGGIIQHQNEFHADQTLVCMHDGCESIFTHQKAFDKHIKLVHEEDPVDCPFEGCNARMSKSSLNRHIKRRHPGAPYGKPQFPCPLAAQEGCEETFPSQISVSMHLNLAHAGKIPCRYAAQCECDQTFGDTEDEIRHARRNHTYYMCNVQDCVNTVSGRWLTYHAIHHHRSLHEYSEHFSAGSELTEFTKLVPGDSRWDEVVKWHRGTDRKEAQVSMLSRTEWANRNDSSEEDMASIEDAMAEDEVMDEDESTAETSEEGVFELVVAGSNLEHAEEQAASVRERNIKLLLSKHHRKPSCTLHSLTSQTSQTFLIQLTPRSGCGVSGLTRSLTSLLGPGGARLAQ